MDKQEYIGHISPILPTNFVIPERYQEFIEYENTMLKWLEKQVEQRVATQIFKELDLMIAHPPCTYLAVSGARWFKDKINEQYQAIDFVRTLLNAPIQKDNLDYYGEGEGVKE